MRVLLDASAILDDRSGVARRLMNLWPRVIERVPGLRLDLVVHPEFAPSARRRFDGCGIIEATTGSLSPIRRAFVHVPFLERTARRLDTELIFQETWPIAVPARTVVTIHDLRFLDRRFGGSFLRSLYANLCLPRVLARVARVITVSRAVASEVEERLRVPADKIRVVPNGVDPNALFGREGGSDVLRRIGLAEGEYFLVVGHREPRKNLETVIAVAAAWKERGRGDRFVVVGRKRSGYDAPERAVARGGLETTVHFLDDIPDEDLVALYRGARALLAPSLFEGFCLPVLEAMAASIPVIAPRGPPYEEVAGARAIVAHPTSEREWMVAMIELENPLERERAIAIGSERVAAFRWEDAAAKLSEILDEL